MPKLRTFMERNSEKSVVRFLQQDQPWAGENDRHQAPAHKHTTSPAGCQQQLDSGGQPEEPRYCRFKEQHPETTQLPAAEGGAASEHPCRALPSVGTQHQLLGGRGHGSDPGLPPPSPGRGCQKEALRPAGRGRSAGYQKLPAQSGHPRTTSHTQAQATEAACACSPPPPYCPTHLQGIVEDGNAGVVEAGV